MNVALTTYTANLVLYRLLSEKPNNKIDVPQVVFQAVLVIYIRWV
jgi:hypothetical protein